MSDPILDEIAVARAWIRKLPPSEWMAAQALNFHLDMIEKALRSHEFRSVECDGERYDCSIHGTGDGPDCPRC